MATEIAMSITESEYTGASYALREAIPVMELLKELQKMKIPVPSSKAKVHCRLHEDNSGALTLAKAPAMRSRTKHINVKYHHFRLQVANGSILIEATLSGDQLATFLTKQSTPELFRAHRKLIMGW